ncbi:splicing factor 3B [Aspergillus affinis]|uniref:splicing factor 3B n=1 Tax=Aspergillus affinis TaxID=1070780 RepID=UPI0022FDC11F|nr:splicing factor 3B [Aspergillus affinis]KAI9045728.1 splicing factor 3B [Aspergillus affinis]
MADKLRTLQNLEAMQARYVGTGHADTTKYEWTSNIVRDSYASYIGHPPMLSYMAVGMGEPKEKVRAAMIEKMVRGAGNPPEESSGNEAAGSTSSFVLIKQDLPNELLYDIAGLLEYADDASAFSRSCHFLYSLINDTLVARYAKGLEQEAIEYALEIGDHVLMESLINAAGAGHTELVRLLLDREINGVYDAWFLEMPPTHALLHEHWETARLLMSYGADPDYKIEPYEWSQTALATMAHRGSLEGLRFLVENTKSTLEGKDSPWKTTLPCGRQLREAMKVSFGDFYIADAFEPGRTLLGVAVGGYHPRVKELTELLLELGANVDATDSKSGETALVHAVKIGNCDAVDILLNHGADLLFRINKSEASETPLHQALVSQRSSCLRIILKAVEARGLQWDISPALREVRQYKDRPDPMDRELLGPFLNDSAEAILSGDIALTGNTSPECARLVKYLVQHYCRVKYPCPL